LGLLHHGRALDAEVLLRAVAVVRRLELSARAADDVDDDRVLDLGVVPAVVGVGVVLLSGVVIVRCVLVLGVIGGRVLSRALLLRCRSLLLGGCRTAGREGERQGQGGTKSGRSLHWGPSMGYRARPRYPAPPDDCDARNSRAG